MPARVLTLTCRTGAVPVPRAGGLGGGPPGGFPGGSDGKESACSAGAPGLMPGCGKSPGEGSGNPLQYSCLEKPITEEPGGL